MTELTPKNIEIIKDIFDLKTFHPADAYNQLQQMGNWDVKEICGRFEDIPYKNKRVFAKKIIDMAIHIKDNSL